MSFCSATRSTSRVASASLSSCTISAFFDHRGLARGNRTSSDVLAGAPRTSPHPKVLPHFRYLVLAGSLAAMKLPILESRRAEADNANLRHLVRRGAPCLT